MRPDSIGSFLRSDARLRALFDTELTIHCLKRFVQSKRVENGK